MPKSLKKSALKSQNKPEAYKPYNIGFSVSKVGPSLTLLEITQAINEVEWDLAQEKTFGEDVRRGISAAICSLIRKFNSLAGGKERVGASEGARSATERRGTR